MKQINNKNQPRRRAREIALQAGYVLDVNGISEDDKASESFDVFLLNSEIAEENSVIEYAKELVLGVAKNLYEIDSLVRKNITGWRPERMSATDRVAIHIAIYEGIISKNVDLPVAISEAVEIARLFGSDESARFVNGVLGRVARAS